MHINESTQLGEKKLISSKLPTFSKDTIVSKALDVIKKQSTAYDSVSLLFVLEEGMLCGVLSIQELLSADAQKTLSDIMTATVISVDTDLDRISLIHTALEHEQKALPVVHQGKFVGAVLPHTLLHVLKLEYANDRYKSAGIELAPHDSYDDLSVWQRVKGRTPWLIIGLAGGVISALIVDQFSVTLSKEIVLAAFIPAIVNIGDAIGNQTELLFIRWLGRQHSMGVLSYLRREWLVGTIIGIFLGLIIFVGSYLWLDNVALSLVLGLAILATTYVSIGITVILPWTLEKLHIDPAVASGPLATVLCDIASLAIYLMIAAALL